MNRWYLLAATSLVTCMAALLFAMTPVAAERKNAPCPPWCDPPTVHWKLTCVNPSSTVITAPLDAQWVGIGGKLCYLVVAERPKM